MSLVWILVFGVDATNFSHPPGYAENSIEEPWEYRRQQHFYPYQPTASMQTADDIHPGSDVSLFNRETGYPQSYYDSYRGNEPLYTHPQDAVINNDDTTKSAFPARILPENYYQTVTPNFDPYANSQENFSEGVANYNRFNGFRSPWETKGPSGTYRKYRNYFPPIPQQPSRGAFHALETELRPFGITSAQPMNMPLSGNGFVNRRNYPEEFPTRSLSGVQDQSNPFNDILHPSIVRTNPMISGLSTEQPNENNIDSDPGIKENAFKPSPLTDEDPILENFGTDKELNSNITRESESKQKVVGTNDIFEDLEKSPLWKDVQNDETTQTVKGSQHTNDDVTSNHDLVTLNTDSMASDLSSSSNQRETIGNGTSKNEEAGKTLASQLLDISPEHFKRVSSYRRPLKRRKTGGSHWSFWSERKTIAPTFPVAGIRDSRFQDIKMRIVLI